jgi:hypothetical protein
VLHGIDNYIVSYTNSIRNMGEYMNSEKSIKYYWIFDEASHQLKVVSNKEMETKTVRNAENRKFYNSVKEAENDMPEFRHLYV